jgi:hypothetical protein
LQNERAAARDSVRSNDYRGQDAFEDRPRETVRALVMI